MKSRNLLAAVAFASTVIAIALPSIKPVSTAAKPPACGNSWSKPWACPPRSQAPTPASAIVQPPPSRQAPIAVPAAESPAPVPVAPAISETEPWLAQFDRAMDREFTRIEEREQNVRDPAELALLAELKTALMDLDRTWTEMDAGEKSATEREALASQARNQMLAVMRLAAADRNLRLARVAHALGVEDAATLDRFLSDVDQVYRDTDLDWASLFSRGF
jgi:hypothetical protein